MVLLDCECVQLPLLYIKPVQTGFPQDSDARAVVRWLPHAAHLAVFSAVIQQQLHT